MSARPWEAPGFKFYTDEARRWLCGYEPILAAQDCRIRDEERAKRRREAQRKGAETLRAMVKGRG